MTAGSLALCRNTSHIGLDWPPTLLKGTCTACAHHHEIRDWSTSIIHEGLTIVIKYQFNTLITVEKCIWRHPWPGRVCVEETKMLQAILKPSIFITQEHLSLLAVRAIALATFKQMFWISGAHQPQFSFSAQLAVYSISSRPRQYSLNLKKAGPHLLPATGWHKEASNVALLSDSSKIRYLWSDLPSWPARPVQRLGRHLSQVSLTWLAASQLLQSPGAGCTPQDPCCQVRIPEVAHAQLQNFHRPLRDFLSPGTTMIFKAASECSQDLSSGTPIAADKICLPKSIIDKRNINYFGYSFPHAPP
ncbi:hypothetical protein CEXT_792881 [Caerostris extrusa]|uniref:Uncharacterized protein n=1 Tax=Caerostris extrusa TaxID=172846 RepID=A0AAV4MK00_CAEEX|nr:hypothetical protein CEXT_792881 [Caerostris extrusa]